MRPRLLLLLSTVVAAACSQKHPSLTQCDKALDHVVMLSIEGGDMLSDEMKTELRKGLERETGDKINVTCHEQATPAQVACLAFAKSPEAALKCAEGDAKKWAWARPILESLRYVR